VHGATRSGGQADEQHAVRIDRVVTLHVSDDLRHVVPGHRAVTPDAAAPGLHLEEGVRRAWANPDPGLEDNHQGPSLAPGIGRRRRYTEADLPAEGLAVVGLLDCRTPADRRSPRARGRRIDTGCRATDQGAQCQRQDSFGCSHHVSSSDVRPWDDCRSRGRGVRKEVSEQFPDRRAANPQVAELPQDNWFPDLLRRSMQLMPVVPHPQPCG